jgi:hypothetical protein
MEELPQTTVSRKKVALRLVWTLICLIIFEILKMIVCAITLFQFFFLLVAQRYSEPLRTFSNRVAAYAYRIIRYTTLNENTRPFPFAEFPAEMEKPADPVTFD